MNLKIAAVGVSLAVLSVRADAVRAARFANPPSDMRLLPCLNGWSAKAIEWANAAGFGGAACSCAWTKNYLRDEGDWKGFASFARQSNKAGLSLWLYDEYGYPSGTAGFEAHVPVRPNGCCTTGRRTRTVRSTSAPHSTKS